MRQKLNLVLTISLALFFVQCKKCKEGENRENSDVAENVKATLFQFSEGTRWVFKSDMGEMDTVFLGPQTYSYDNGSCRDTRECCTKIYHQQIVQTLNYRPDADGLVKFSQFKFPDHVLLYQGVGGFSFSNNQSFDNAYKSTFVISGTTLNDIEVQSSPSPTIGTVADIAYWSLSKGLVRYDYFQGGITYIKYERQDL
jgi:hypothetical protein